MNKKISKRIACLRDLVFNSNQSECTIWPYGTSDPYGLIRFENKNYRVHQVAYFIFHGEIDNKLFVLHKCNNKRCVNPYHLELGSQKKNVQHYWLTDGVHRKKEIKYKKPYKLNHEKFMEIIKLRKEGMNLKDIGLRFGVSESYISLILRGKRIVNYCKQRT